MGDRLVPVRLVNGAYAYGLALSCVITMIAATQLWQLSWVDSWIQFIADDVGGRSHTAIQRYRDGVQFHICPCFYEFSASILNLGLLGRMIFLFQLDDCSPQCDEFGMLHYCIRISAYEIRRFHDLVHGVDD